MGDTSLSQRRVNDLKTMHNYYNNVHNYYNNVEIILLIIIIIMAKLIGIKINGTCKGSKSPSFFFLSSFSVPFSITSV